MEDGVTSIEQSKDRSGVDTAFILSSGHSGSTLLNMMLAGHPDAVAVGEVTHLPKNLALNSTCQCGVPVGDCAFWQEVLRHLPLDLRADPYALETGFINAARVIDHSRATLGYKLRWKTIHAAKGAGLSLGLNVPIPAFERSITHTNLLYDAIRRASGSRLIVDSSKTYLKGLGLYHRSPETVRLVFLCRDGRGVMWSEMKRGMSRQKALTRWRDYYRRSLLLLRDVNPEHWIAVNYEKLTQDPEPEMRRLADFLGLSFHPGLLRLDSKPHHIANGNDMRHRGGAVIATDLGWTRMPEDQLRYFEERAGKLNALLLSKAGGGAAGAKDRREASPR
jgi:hypothetical protein